MDDLKQNLLELLLPQGINGLCTYKIKCFTDELSTDSDKLYITFSCLESDGFITNLCFRRAAGVVSCCLSAKAFGFMEEGGYLSKHAQAELEKEKLRLEVKLLKEELENLKKVNPTLAERIIAVLGNLSTFAGLFT